MSYICPVMLNVLKRLFLLFLVLFFSGSTTIFASVSLNQHSNVNHSESTISCVSEKSSDHRGTKNSESPVFIVEKESEDDDESNSYDKYLRCNQHFVVAFYLSITEETSSSALYQAYLRTRRVSKDLPLYLDLQVFRI